MSIEIIGSSQTAIRRRLKYGDITVSIPIPCEISRLHRIRPNMQCRFHIIFPDITEDDIRQGHGLHRFWDISKKKKEYDYFVITQRLGGIKGHWEEVERNSDFKDIYQGIAEYCSGEDITIRCLGARKEKGRETRKQLWIHYSRGDKEEAKIEEEHKIELAKIKVQQGIEEEFKKLLAITPKDEVSKILKAQVQRIAELEAKLNVQQRAAKI
jgi:hypothetical protein